jgi:hypothetical protein
LTTLLPVTILRPETTTEVSVEWSRKMSANGLRTALLAVALLGALGVVSQPMSVHAGPGDPPPSQPPPVVELTPEIVCQLIPCQGLPVIAVIDIKPGTFPNCFNNDGHGVIPVAILGSPTFDVTKIILSSVRLQGMQVNLVGKGAQASLQDVNGDGYLDVLVMIQDVDGVFSPGAAYALLTGLTTDFQPFAGGDSVCILQ